MSNRPTFTLTTLQEALTELAELARAEGKVVDVAIYGGAALMLVSNFRVSTRDVDAVADDDGQRFIERLAAVVAERRKWPADWLNDDVFPFLSDAVDGVSEHHHLFRSYPCEHEPGLRVYVPSAEYILAMKLMAMRIGSADSKDRADILNLMTILGLATAEETLAFVTRFYPDAKATSKVVMGIEELFRSGENLGESLHDVAPTYLGRGGPPHERRRG